jgi:hypothetical protein
VESKEKLVPVAFFTDSIAAELAKGGLESEGIECFWGRTDTGSAVDGVALQVRESDLDRARRILSEKLTEDELYGISNPAYDRRYRRFARTMLLLIPVVMALMLLYYLTQP